MRGRASAARAANSNQQSKTTASSEDCGQICYLSKMVLLNERQRSQLIVPHLNTIRIKTANLWPSFRSFA